MFKKKKQINSSKQKEKNRKFIDYLLTIGQKFKKNRALAHNARK
jgi:hypothetical protein